MQAAAMDISGPWEAQAMLRQHCECGRCLGPLRRKLAALRQGLLISANRYPQYLEPDSYANWDSKDGSVVFIWSPTEGTFAGECNLRLHFVYLKGSYIWVAPGTSYYIKDNFICSSPNVPVPH